MQRWMKATLQTYQRAGDQERLARAFNELADHAPAGYDTWQALAKQGADAAARSDVAAVKQVCKDCHHAHRSRFRKERRSAPTW
jgi:RNA polymerase-interacting CarD/CdnL/TRCF family regulator